MGRALGRYAMALAVVAVGTVGMWVSTTSVKGASSCYVYCNLPQGHVVCTDNNTFDNKVTKNKNYCLIDTVDGTCPSSGYPCTNSCDQFDCLQQ